MKIHGVLAGIVILAGIAVSERASADVFRCQLPDGSFVFTDREEMCPGVDSHEIDVEIQSYDRSPASVAPAPVNASATARGQGAEQKKGEWREKKVRAEQELSALEEKWDYLNQYITHCNRHRKILSRNASGLPYEVSCGNIREEYGQVKYRMSEVRAYLDVGLEEECRRAGCLPGWVR